MRIERPLFLLPEEFRHESYPTIGKLYEMIRQAIVDNADEVHAAFTAGGPANQVGDNIGFNTFVPGTGVDAVELFSAGIEEILEQGEGSTVDTIQAGPAYQNEESHYGKFAELWYGRLYQPPHPLVPLTRETEEQWFQGEEIPWPEVVNTLAVPSDGYVKLLTLDPDGAAVGAEMRTFDKVYTGMLNSLDAMWNGPADAQWPTFGEAVKAMVELRVLSCFTIMRHEVPAKLITQLPRLYPGEFDFLSTYTDLNQPVFYGPRFTNINR